MLFRSAQTRWATEKILTPPSTGDSGGPSIVAARKRVVPSEPTADAAPALKKTKIVKKAGMKPGEGVRRKKIPQSKV